MSFGFGFGFPRRAAAGGAAPSLNFDFTSLTSLPGRITFSRTSNATLTDSNGRVSYAPHNLVTNSEDFEAAAWTKTSSTVTANTTSAPDGTTTADTLTCAAATALTAVLGSVTSVAATYTWSIYVKQKEVRYVQLLWTGLSSTDYANFDLQTGTITAGTYAGATITSAGSGWYRITITSALAAGSTSPYLAFINAGSNARATSYVGNGTDGVFTWGAQLNVANAPVNLLTFSEQFDNAVWSKSNLNTTGTPPWVNVAVAPDGTTTADKLIEDTTNNLHRISSGGMTLNFVSGTTYTVSVYAQFSGRQYLNLNANSSINARSTFDLVAGTVASTLVGTASIVAIGGGWYRCSVTGTATVTGTNSFYCQLSNTSASGDVSYLGDGTSGIFIWGAQLNTGSTALPYVATTSSIYLPPSYNSTTPKNLLGFTQEFDNAAWTKSNSFVQTNLLTWSEQFDNVAWTKTGLLAFGSGSVANTTATTDPLGGNTADLIVQDSSAGVHSVTLNPSLAGGVYSGSVYVKTAGATRVALLLENAGGTYYAYFDIVAGQVTGQPGSGGGVASITSAGNGWWRIVISSQTLIAPRTFIYMCQGATNTVSFTGDGTSGIYIWGAQLVQGSVPGDYQVTTSAAAAVQYSDPNGTRTADKLVEDTSASTTHRVFNGSAVTIPTTGPSANTIYAKAGERTAVRLTDNDIQGADFDLLTGAVSNLGTGVTASATNVGGGWWRLSVVRTCATVSGRVVLYLLSGGTITYTGNGTSGIYIWGAQLSNSASVDSYVYNPQAALTSTAYYGPRFDYNAVTLAANGLLIEEQRTNLFTYSQDFSNAFWQPTNITVTNSATTAPDGTNTAQSIAATAAVSTLLVSAATTVSATSATYSIYAKQGSGANLANTFLLRNNTTATNLLGGTINYSTGAFTYSVGSTGVTVQNVGNSWWRIVMTVTSGVTAGDGLRGYIGFTGGTETAGTFLYAWGAQLEAGSFATSYIPTVASQVTRAADNASMLGDNFATWYNATEGTISSEASCFGLRAASNGVVGIADGTVSNRFGTYTITTNSAVGNYMVTGGATQADLVVNSAAANSAVFKSAFGYKVNDFASSVNGGTALTDTSGSIATVNRLLIGNLYDVIATNQLNGWVRRIAYYPTRLPNATLQSITT